MSKNSESAAKFSAVKRVVAVMGYDYVGITWLHKRGGCPVCNKTRVVAHYRDDVTGEKVDIVGCTECDTAEHVVTQLALL